MSIALDLTIAIPGRNEERNLLGCLEAMFFMDADEYLAEGFKAALWAALKSDTKAGYWLRYAVYFMGQHYPLRKLALFQVGAGEYERIDEARWSRLDMEVHEHPVLQGETGLFW